MDVAWVDAEHIERDGAAAHVRDGLDGILVPGGFGDRGIEGKIEAVRYAREQRVPYFGICLGMQCAVIEYARHVCGLAGANSTEFDPTPPHTGDRPPARAARRWPTRAARCGSASIRSSSPRAARPRGSTGRGSSRSATGIATRSTTTTSPTLEKNGLRISGIWAEKQLVEIIELADHPWFVAGQFHPEFRSRPWEPHPLFAGFVQGRPRPREARPTAP